jgi:hypothetical protein
LLLGVILYFVQTFQLKHLVTPWYLPILFTLGVLLALVSVRQRPTWTRVIASLVLALLCAGSSRLERSTLGPPCPACTPNGLHVPGKRFPYTQERVEPRLAWVRAGNIMGHRHGVGLWRLVILQGRLLRNAPPARNSGDLNPGQCQHAGQPARLDTDGRHHTPHPSDCPQTPAPRGIDTGG